MLRALSLFTKGILLGITAIAFLFPLTADSEISDFLTNLL
jgi:hypothetical protein